MTVVVTPFGAPALDALRAAVAELRGDDPLGAVDVAVPSAFVGVTARRRLAVPALAGVRFAPLPRLLAERALEGLAAAGRAPVTAAQRRAAVRAVLVASPGPLGAAARRSGATVGVVAGVFAELDEADADDATLDGLAARGGWPAELAALYRAYRGGLEGAAAPGEVARAALAAPGAPLVVYLPRRLSPVEARWCAALSGSGRLRVIVGVTGEGDADRDAVAVLRALGADPARPAVPAARATGVRALPDAEEEARFAVRQALRHLQDDPAARADRVGIAFRAATPYARLVSEQLTAAGLPFHAPALRGLAQTVPGRVLLGLLRLPETGWSRTAVFDWLRGAPVRDGAARCPTAAWQRLAGEAGVSRGPQQWAARLERLARATESVAVDDGVSWPAERAAAARSLARFVAAAVDRVERVGAAGSWARAADLLAGLLEHYLGGAGGLAGWAPARPDGADPRARGEAERRAHESVVAVLGELARLDERGCPFDAAALVDALGQELARPVREASGLGRGVLVGPVWDFVGADLDLLVVVGAAEGLYPPRAREHPLLRDDARAAAGLRTLADRRAAERRDHLAVLAGAATVLLTHPVADPRAQRGAEPARWALEQTRPRRRAAEQQATAPPSFQASVCDPADPAVSASEFDVRLAVPAAPLSDAHPLLAAEPDLARGVRAARARAHGVFGPWTGGLARPLPAPVTAALDATLSASLLQRYAECPFQFFLRHVLGVRGLDEPDEDRVDAAARGTAVHEVLERLVGEAIARGKPAGEPWTAAEHDRAQTLLAEQLDRLLADGRAGRPTPWRVEARRRRRQLRQMLLADEAYRKDRGARPVAVEHRFGGDAPLSVALPSGPVRLAGCVDRVDACADGSLVVLDYKTGRSRADGYATFPEEGTTPGAAADLTGRGRHLQLPLYALAARRDLAPASAPGGTPPAVSGYYWFVDEGGTRRGGPIDAAAQGRFLDVLDTVAAGIRDGAFPVRPGEFDAFYRSFDSCAWCEFTRVCSTGRVELWERLREDPRVRRYARLAEPPTGEQESQP